MSGSVGCQNCWLEKHEFVPAGFRAPDATPLCLPCVNSEGYEVAECSMLRVKPNGTPHATPMLRGEKPKLSVLGGKGPVLGEKPEIQSREREIMPKIQPQNKACANPECGKEFMPPRKDAKYCSLPCRVRVSNSKRSGAGPPKRLGRPRKLQTPALASPNSVAATWAALTPGSGMTLTITVAGMERLWAMFSPLEKANAIRFVLAAG